MTATKEDIIKKLRSELAPRKLYPVIAKQYGCQTSYVSNVLNGQVKYNASLIEVAVEVLEQAKNKENAHLAKVAKKIFP